MGLQDLIANAILERVPIEVALVNSIKGLLEEYDIVLTDEEILYHIMESLKEYDNANS